MSNKHNFLNRYRLATERFGIDTFCGFHETLKHGRQRSPGIHDPITISIKINAESVSGELVPVSGDVVRYEGSDTEGTFSKLGPFYLKIYR